MTLQAKRITMTTPQTPVSPTAPPAETLTVKQRAGLPTVRIELPPPGFAIYHASPALHPHPPQDLKPWTESTWHGAIRKN